MVRKLNTAISNRMANAYSRKRILLVALGIAYVILLVLTYQDAGPVRGLRAALEPWIAFLLVGCGVAGCWLFDRLPKHLACWISSPIGSREVLIWIAAVLLLFGNAGRGRLADERPVWDTASRQISNQFNGLGVLPVSDSWAHLEGAVTLNESGEINQWNSKRPISCALAGLRLRIAGGKPSKALWVQIAGLALSGALAGGAVLVSLGRMSTLLFLGLIYGYSRDHAFSWMSASSGVMFGFLAIPLLLQGIQQRGTVWWLTGCAVLWIGEAIRPGLILVPVLGALGFTVFQTYDALSRRQLKEIGGVVRTGSIAVFLFLTPLVFANLLERQAVTTDGGGNRNAILTLCGITLGGDYKSTYQAYPSQFASLSESEIDHFLKKQIVENLKSQPGTAIRKIASNFTYAAGALPVRVASSWIPRPMVSLDRLLKPSQSILWMVIYVLLILCLIIPLTYRAIRNIVVGNSSPEIKWGWLGFLGGGLALLPIVYSDGGFRIISVTFPLIALFLSLGVAPCAKNDSHPVVCLSERMSWNSLLPKLCCGLLVVLLFLSLGFALLGSSKSESFDRETEISQEESAGDYKILELHRFSSLKQEGYIDLSRVRRLLPYSEPDFAEGWQQFDGINQSFDVAILYDMDRRRLIYGAKDRIAPEDVGETIGLCVRQVKKQMYWIEDQEVADSQRALQFKSIGARN